MAEILTAIEQAQMPELLGACIWASPIPDEERDVKFRVIRADVWRLGDNRPGLYVLELGDGREFTIRNQFDLTEVTSWPG